MKVFDATSKYPTTALRLVLTGDDRGTYALIHNTQRLAFATPETVKEMIQRGHAAKIPDFAWGHYGYDGGMEYHHGILVFRCSYSDTSETIELLPEVAPSEDVLVFLRWHKKNVQQHIRQLPRSANLWTKQGDINDWYSVVHLQTGGCLMLTHQEEVPMPLAKPISGGYIKTRLIDVDTLVYSLSRCGQQMATNLKLD